MSGEHDDRTLKGLFVDLEKVINYLCEHLPEEITTSMSTLIMPKLTPRIKTIWLNTAVPTSLNDMLEYRKVLALVHEFAEILDKHRWAGGEEYNDWVSGAPKLWLTKRKEKCLDETRVGIAQGLGKKTLVERHETHEISREEGQNITANGKNDDWDAAWSDGEDAPPKNIEMAGNDSPQSNELSQVKPNTTLAEDDEDDAWGWGDADGPAIDEGAEEDTSLSENFNAPVPGSPSLNRHSLAKREVTLTEKYQISSIPEAVLRNIKQILDDGAALTQHNNEENPVTAAAVGLFALPTLVLAMYRAVSPHHYSRSAAGNM